MGPSSIQPHVEPPRHGLPRSWQAKAHPATAAARRGIPPAPWHAPLPCLRSRPTPQPRPPRRNGGPASCPSQSWPTAFQDSRRTRPRQAMRPLPPSRPNQAVQTQNRALFAARWSMPSSAQSPAAWPPRPADQVPFRVQTADTERAAAPCGQADPSTLVSAEEQGRRQAWFPDPWTTPEGEAASPQDQDPQRLARGSLLRPQRSRWIPPAPLAMPCLEERRHCSSTSL
mmetsp:Transcript_21569/g.52547  ORF Transcript_21569/g.52547 Transcript_21569/m.52547 type:complete len:228 (-) Transcript_21569:503-1186(-)